MAKKTTLSAPPGPRSAVKTGNIDKVVDDGPEPEKHLSARVPASVHQRYTLLGMTTPGKVRALLIEAIDLLEDKHGKA